MLKRTLEVKLTNPKKNHSPDEPSEESVTVDYAQLLHQAAEILRDNTETFATKAIIRIAVYVGMDTLRQVIVKMTPTN